MSESNEHIAGERSNLSKSTPVVPEEIGAHRVMVLWLFVATVAVVVTLLLFLVFREQSEEVSIFLLVIAAGALGGFVSCLRRLYAFEDVFPLRQYAGLFRNVNFYVVAYSTIPPLVGMIAAAVVYLIFASKFLEGPAFPSFHCTVGENRCTTFQTFMHSWSPQNAVDYAKALVWGFAAGFSERYFIAGLQFLPRART